MHVCMHVCMFVDVCMYVCMYICMYNSGVMAPFLYSISKSNDN